MKTIATLGPKGTFSDNATRVFVDMLNEECRVDYFESIRSSLKSIGNSCDYGVLPIENLSEGFVSIVLDHLVDSDLFVIGEIILPIQFSYVSKTEITNGINKLFVQFVAKGQCSRFIDTLSKVDIVTTESNIESLERLLSSDEICGAVVPSNSFLPSDFLQVTENINDYKNNQTRFLILSRFETNPINNVNEGCKSSIVVLDGDNHPGLLQEVLAPFSKRGINLTSIVSRPTRDMFGKYHFFIDFDGQANDPKVSDALIEIGRISKVKFLGSYPKAKICSNSDSI